MATGHWLWYGLYRVYAELAWLWRLVLNYLAIRNRLISVVVPETISPKHYIACRALYLPVVVQRIWLRQCIPGFLHKLSRHACKRVIYNILDVFHLLHANLFANQNHSMKVKRCTEINWYTSCTNRLLSGRVTGRFGAQERWKNSTWVR